MDSQAAIFVFAIGAAALSAVFIAIHEMRWRDKLSSERLTAKDRECLARIDGTTDAAANIMRKFKWSSNDDARAAR